MTMLNRYTRLITKYYIFTSIKVLIKPSLIVKTFNNLGFGVFMYTFLIGCGPQNLALKTNSCKVIPTTLGSVISCPDGTTSFVANGINGSNGEEGDNGAQGVAGVDGANGVRGATGAQGVHGATGSQGAQGWTGAQGAAGPQGPQGWQGMQGLTGSQGAQGATGTAGSTGPMGQVGSVGQTGATGNQGLTGNTGDVGAQGASGTSVVPVQFCPNYKTSYPAVFAEQALCISNKLYAVYWDNRNSWLTEVPPGRYYSTSTSAPCNFTVVANCGVVQGCN